MTNHTKLLLTIFSALLILVSGVSAQIDVTLVQHDTDVQSTYDHLKACSCGGQVDSVRVKNLGMLDSYYSFELEADKNWFTLDRAGAWLRPGEYIDVYVFTSAPCDAVDTASYKVYVASEYGRYRAVEKTIQVGVCENIKASITPTYSTLQPCETQYYELTLTNVATFTETYEVEWLGFPTVTIPAGETRVLSGSYTATCDEWGNKTIPVTVKSLKNGLLQKLPVDVEVLRAYDYRLEIENAHLPICAGVTGNIPVRITNLENRDNTIELSTKPDGNSTSIYIGGNDAELVYLPFTPTRAGTREFSVQATSLNGTIEKQAKLSYDVEACYGYTIEAPSKIEACPGSVAIPFTITSEGSRTQALDLIVSSNTTTSTNSLDANLRAGEVITKLVHTIITDADREYYVTLEASTPYWTESTTVNVEGHSTESCYSVAPTAHKFKVWKDQEVVPIIVQQDGIEPATYTISYNGTFAQVEETDVTLSPGQSAVIHLLINATDYESGRYVDRLTLSTSNVDYVTDFELTLREKGLWENFLDSCRADDGFAVCSATSTAALLFLIIVIIFVAAIITKLHKYENPRDRSKEMWGIVGGILLILLLLLMVWTAPNIPRAYERPIGPSSPTDLTFEIGQGQSATIDLKAYFSDDDNDTLRFVASPSDKLTTTIKGSNVTIHADSKLAGTEYLVFTANDGRGGLTDSDVFTVTVVPYKPITFLEYWTRACWFLTTLFLFIGLALLLLVVLLSPKAKEERQHRSIATIETIDGRPLTQLERQIVSQQGVADMPHTMVRADNIIINQGEQTEKVYVASQDGKRFHKLNCQIVRNMPKEKRITFSTKEDAIKGGYSPCKTCQAHQ